MMQYFDGRVIGPLDVVDAPHEWTTVRMREDRLGVAGDELAAPGLVGRGHLTRQRSPQRRERNVTLQFVATCLKHHDVGARAKRFLDQPRLSGAWLTEDEGEHAFLGRSGDRRGERDPLRTARDEGKFQPLTFGGSRAGDRDWLA